MALLVFDTFIGANGTDIADHTPDIDVIGGGWIQAYTNEVELDGSGAVKFTGAGDDARIDVGTADQVLTFSINAGGADNRFTASIRADNDRPVSGNNYDFQIAPAVSGGNNVFIRKRISGSVSTIVSSEISLNSSTTYEIEFSVIGSDLVAKVDGVTVLSNTDTDITTGDYAGFYHSAYANGNLRLYDFTVDDGANPAEITDTTTTTTSTANIDAIALAAPFNIADSLSSSLSITNADAIALSALVSISDAITNSSSATNTDTISGGQFLIIDTANNTSSISNADTITFSSVVSINDSVTNSNSSALNDSILTIGAFNISDSVNNTESTSNNDTVTIINQLIIGDSVVTSVSTALNDGIQIGDLVFMVACGTNYTMPDLSTNGYAEC